MLLLCAGESAAAGARFGRERRRGDRGGSGSAPPVRKPLRSLARRGTPARTGFWALERESGKGNACREAVRQAGALGPHGWWLLAACGVQDRRVRASDRSGRGGSGCRTGCRAMMPQTSGAEA